MFGLGSSLRRGWAICLAALVMSLTAAQGRADDRPAEATKVHLVLVGYTPDTIFGKACRDDIEAMKSTLSEGFADKKDRLVIHDLSGIDPETKTHWSAKQVMGYLRGMKIGPNESVVVYHSGHGRIADKQRPEATHRLQLTDKSELSRGEITSVLLCKHPRALIVLTDCCSAIVPDRDAGGAAGQCGEAGLNGETVRNLFLKVRGVISITAAEDGTCGVIGFSGPNPAGAGSSFTVALLRLCWNEDRVYASWGQFFPSLREECFRTSDGRHRARDFRMSEGGK